MSVCMCAMTAGEGVQRVKIRERREEGRGGREADEGTEREFNSTVDYAASLPDYCRYAFPFCADEGITLRVYYIRAGARNSRRISCNARVMTQHTRVRTRVNKNVCKGVCACACVRTHARTYIHTNNICNTRK